MEINVSIRSIGEIMNDLVGQTKAELIQDCMNYQKQLVGFGCDLFLPVLHDPVGTFDMLHDMPMDEIAAFNHGLSSLCRTKALQLIDNYK